MSRVHKPILCHPPQNEETTYYTSLKNMVAWADPLGRKGLSSTTSKQTETTPDKTLINTSNFTRLYKLYRPLILSFFIRQHFPVEEARDLTQDVFVRAYEKRDTFKGSEDSSFKAWLYTIATSIWKNRLRSEDTQKRAGKTTSLDALLTEDLLPNPLGDPLEKVIIKEELTPLYQAIIELPEFMRFCLILREYKHYSYQQISIITKRSVSTIKNQLHQAKKQLRIHLTCTETTHNSQ